MHDAIKPGVPTVAIIEGASFFAATKDVGFDPDYARLRDWLHANADLIRAPAYHAEFRATEYSPVARLVQWLRCNGYTAFARPIDDGFGPQGMAVTAAVALLEAAAAGRP